MEVIRDQGMVNLDRPRPGQPNSVRLSSGIRHVKLISRRFICPKCQTFCGELIPVLDGATRQWMRSRRKTLMSPELQVKVFCFSGCHDSDSWGWGVFNWSSIGSLNKVKEWPSDWSNKDIEMRVREDFPENK